MSIAADNRLAELERWRSDLEAEIRALHAQIRELLDAATQAPEVRRERPR